MQAFCRSSGAAATDPKPSDHGPPNRSQESIEAAVQAAATRHLNLLRPNAYNRGPDRAGVRHCGRRPAPSTIRPPIRCSSSPRPTSSIGASHGSQNQRLSVVAPPRRPSSLLRPHAPPVATPVTRTRSKNGPAVTPSPRSPSARSCQPVLPLAGAWARQDSYSLR